jgi:hypothetical protein
MTATPHGDKLKALLNNAKIPEGDKARVEAQVVLYDAWIATMDGLQDEGDALLTALVDALNTYKKSVEFDLIFCSEADFLYRQKGQLKLDNTILEEFLPRLFDQRLVNGLARQEGLECGPKKSFSGLSFDSPILALSEGGAYLKAKDQDFSITRKHNMVISRSDKPADRFSEDFHVSYFASEIKTNLDKTMFQEGAATAAELKKSTTGSRYILLCEWLDMKPISTKLTAIDEVIILRRSKRIGSHVRSNFSTVQGRAAHRDWFEKFLDDHPLDIESFKRFVFHLNECFPDADHDAEDIVLGRGFF